MRAITGMLKRIVYNEVSIWLRSGCRAVLGERLGKDSRLNEGFWAAGRITRLYESMCSEVVYRSKWMW